MKNKFVKLISSVLILSFVLTGYTVSVPAEDVLDSSDSINYTEEQAIDEAAETEQPEEQTKDEEIELQSTDTIDMDDFVNNFYPNMTYFKSNVSPLVSKENDVAEVDTLTGNATVTQTDLVLKGKNGLDFELTRYYNSGQANYCDAKYDTINDHAVENPTYNQKNMDIGMGWEFDIPSIETRGSGTNNKFLHWGSKGTWQLKTATNGALSGFKDYNLKDMQITQNVKTRETILSMKDGTKYLFFGNGKLKEIRNKYDDVITFSYKSVSNKYIYVNTINIVDTVGRQIEISQKADRDDITDVVVTVHSPTEEDRTITYNVTTIDVDNMYTKLRLESVIDTEGRQTTYHYTHDYQDADHTVNWQYGSQINMYVDYCLLSDIVLPTGAAKRFVYSKDRITYKNGIKRDVFPVTESYEYDSTEYSYFEEHDKYIIKNNDLKYHYCENYEIQHFNNSASGLGKYGIVLRDSKVSDTNLRAKGYCTYIEGQYSDIVRIFNINGDVVSEITGHGSYNNSSKMVTVYKVYKETDLSYYLNKKSYNSGDKDALLISEKKNITYGYRTDDNTLDINKKSVVTENYVYYTNESGQIIYGDVIEYTCKSGEKEQKTSYKYLNNKQNYSADNPYHIPIEIKRQTDEEKYVVEQYTLTEDKKNIADKSVYDFDGKTLKEKYGYSYNEDGTLNKSIIYNLINGQENGVISETEYIYTDNKNRTDVSDLHMSFDGLNITQIKVINNKSVTDDAEITNAQTVLTENYVYDDYDNLIEKTDAKGNVTKNEYYKDNKLKTVINPDNTRISFEYIINNGENKIIQTDERGNKTELIYDIYGNPVYEYDKEKDKVLKTYEYDGVGRVKGVYDYVNSNSTFYTYHPEFGDLVSVETKNEEIWFSSNIPLTKEYKTWESNAGWILKDGAYVQYLNKKSALSPKSFGYQDLINTITLNENDYLFMDIETNSTVNMYVTADGKEEKLEYDPLSTAQKKLVSAKENGLSGKTIDGIRFEISGDNGETYIYRVGIYRGNGTDNILDTADKSLSNVELGYEYANESAAAKITKSMSGSTATEDIKEEYFFDADGNNIRKDRYKGDTLAYTDTYEYDYNGNVLKQYSPENTEIPFMSYEYDYAGRAISATNAAGNTAYTAYDSAGRVITETDYEQNVTSYEYDSLGRAIKAEKAIDSETGLNNTVITAYDELGNAESIWTSNNEPGQAITYDRVSYEYNWRNSPVKETLYNNNGDDPESYTQYYYDEAGNLVRMYTGMSEPLTITGLDSVSGGGDGYSTIKYEYDYLNRLVKTVDALGQEETYTPNYNGTNDIKVDRNGNKIQSDYDYLGNLINISSETTDGKKYSHSYEYNKLGAVIKADNVTFEYDNLGNMVKETDNDNHTVKEYAYDSFGNRTEFKLTVNGAEEQHLKYEYNDVNLLDKILDLRDNSIIEEYEYTPNGIISQKYTPATNVTVYYESNNAGQIKKITVKKGEETIGEYEYSYYANGNQKDKREVINSSEAKETEYEYDGLGRLVTETSGNTTTKYNYDTRGNRTSMEVTGGDLPYTKNYEYDRNNRLKTENKVLSSGTETIRYSYDPNGNMVSMASSGVTQSKESPEISIGGIQSSGTGIYEYDGFNRLVKVHSGGTEAEYTYHADGLRQSKTVNGVTTKQIWDGSNIVGETDGSGAVLSVYTRGLTGVISDRAGAEETYYIYDGHGDVNMLMNSTGEIIKQYSYDAFGVEQNKDDSDTNPFRYCGEYFDNETESIYLRARYYNPDSGRFITEDPIRDGLNWYSYAANNPIKFVDPWGLTIVTGGSFTDKGTIYSIGDSNTINTNYVDKNKKISINETDTDIFVYAFVEFSGNKVNVQQAIPPYLKQKTYKESFILGVESAWQGEYNMKHVSTTVIEINNLGTEQQQNSVIVEIDQMDIAPQTQVSIDLSSIIIKMSIVDPIGNLKYNATDFELVSAHEFGHALGMSDVYNDKSGIRFDSIMNNQWKTKYAQSAEFAMMMKAYNTQSYQKWGDNIALLDELGVDYIYDK